MDLVDAALLFIGGLCAGVINSLAGGGSLITVPLLALVGLGGVTANGTNRVAVVAQNGSSVIGFARRGVGEWHRTVPVLVPTLIGAALGASVASALPDEVFERLFGLVMIPMLVLSIRNPVGARPEKQTDSAWPQWVKVVVFVGVGIYAGAIQAGVGILVVLVLARAGFDLVTANAMKAILILATATLSSAVFIANGQVQWMAAGVLALGSSAGGYLGANLAVDGGEKLIRPVLVVVVVVLASRMLGLWDLLT